jgi:aminopeptidase-like protein
MATNWPPWMNLINFGELGDAMYDLVCRLYPICRSITGDGLRETLRIVQEFIPLEIREVPSGTKVFDWEVPEEWNIRDAFVIDPQGRRILDFKTSNLHVVSYSTPIHAKLPLAELKTHLHTLPDRPDWIPYRTSYYKPGWGFCLSHRQLSQLGDGAYEICIDSTLTRGSLTYGEFYVRGETPHEVLLSCHVCHPSLCNDNLSGVAVVAFLGKYLRTFASHFSYRILMIPGTIGSITWLALNESHVPAIKHGLVVAGVGDPGSLTYKRSRRGDAEIDKAFEHVLKQADDPHGIKDFSPYGYDERQYCSPGFNLPIGCIQRTPFGQYPEYHTSADNLEFVRPQALADSLQKIAAVLHVVDHNRTYIGTNLKCEPQLGRRGLYSQMGGRGVAAEDQMPLLWVLNLSDGKHSLLDIAERSGRDFFSLQRLAKILFENDLLALVPNP